MHEKGGGGKTHKAVGAFTFHDRIARTVYREHAGPNASHRVSSLLRPSKKKKSILRIGTGAWEPHFALDFVLLALFR